MQSRIPLTPASRFCNALIVAGCLILAGTSLVVAAPAANEGQMCGGIAGIACAVGLWCDAEPGNCNGADIAGTCVKPLPMCTRDYRPVCGCDGITYGNDCSRRAGMIAKNHDGECGTQ